MWASFVLSLLIVSCGAVSIGDRLVRSAGDYTNLPINASAAADAGWKFGSCNPRLGIPATYGTVTHVGAPITLFFTVNGQVSGISVDVFGASPPTPYAGYVTVISSSQYRIELAFRDCARTGSCCSSTLKYAEPIGTGVLLAPSSRKPFTIPLNENAATASNFTRGACIQHMGRHWEYDVSSAPVLSWDANNLLPIIPMFDSNKGTITAVFFASLQRQQTAFPPSDNQWDIIPITNDLMCKNFCSPDCSWKNHEFSLWSTLHLWFVDYQPLSCQSSC